MILRGKSVNFIRKHRHSVIAPHIKCNGSVIKGFVIAQCQFRLRPSLQEAKVASYQKLSRTTPGTSPRDRQFEPAYEKWRRDDLYYLAKQHGIENRADMSTDELARALRDIR